MLLALSSPLFFKIHNVLLKIDSPSTELLTIINKYLAFYSCHVSCPISFNENFFCKNSCDEDFKDDNAVLLAVFYQVLSLPYQTASKPVFTYAGVKGFLQNGKLILGVDGALMEVFPKELLMKGWITNECLSRANEFLLCRLWFKIGLMELLQQAGYYYIHGASLLKDREGVLFVGESGAGKSTITRTLIDKGYSYTCDDALLLMQDKDEIAALGFIEDGQPSFGYSNYVPRIVPRRLIFPKIAHLPKSQLIPISSSLALENLLPASVLIFLQSHDTKGHLRILKSLVEQCSSFLLLMGTDLKDNPSFLEKVLS